MTLKKAIEILEEFDYHISIITNANSIKTYKKSDKSAELLEKALEIVLKEIKK